MKLILISLLSLILNSSIAQSNINCKKMYSQIKKSIKTINSPEYKNTDTTISFILDHNQDCFLNMKFKKAIKLFSSNYTITKQNDSITWYRFNYKLYYLNENEIAENVKDLVLQFNKFNKLSAIIYTSSSARKEI